MQIVDASVALFERSKVSRNTILSLDSQAILTIRVRADAITILLPTMEEIGVLDTKTTNALHTLMADNPCLDFEVFADQEQSKHSDRGKGGFKIAAVKIYMAR